MRSISIRPIKDGKLFDDVAAAKHQPRRGRLEALKATVQSAYKDYKGCAPAVDAVASMALTKEQHDDLVHAYEVETAPLTKARGKLLHRVDAAYCPFCDISEADTLDHYLPKEVYPVFAVYTPNLVPSCGNCNRRKTTLVVDKKTKVRLFRHPYFDAAPTGQYLTLLVKRGATSLTLRFALQQPAGMPAKQFSQLKSHFTRMGLAARYRQRALADLRDRYKALETSFDSGGAAEVSSALNEQADQVEPGRGSNYWQVVLFRTLAADQDFCNQGFKVLTAIQ